MSYSKQELVNFRINRAEESLDEAALLAEHEHWNSAINRMYYACFYAVSALLVKHNLEAKTHSGTKSLLNEHFLKKDIINKKFGKLYANLFNKRQEGDYADLIEFQQSDVEYYLSKSSEFVALIKTHIAS